MVAPENCIDDGEGNTADRMDCGACIGERGDMNIEPDDDAVGCGELPMGGTSLLYGLFRLDSIGRVGSAKVVKLWYGGP